MMAHQGKGKALGSQVLARLLPKTTGSRHLLPTVILYMLYASFLLLAYQLFDVHVALRISREDIAFLRVDAEYYRYMPLEVMEHPAYTMGKAKSHAGSQLAGILMTPLQKKARQAANDVFLGHANKYCDLLHERLIKRKEILGNMVDREKQASDQYVQQIRAEEDHIKQLRDAQHAAEAALKVVEMEKDELEHDIQANIKEQEHLQSLLGREKEEQELAKNAPRIQDEVRTWLH